MIERGPEVQRVLQGSVISLCLDTGHLLIGGTDPAELTRQAPDRIAHTHLKDVDDRIAAQVRSGSGRLTYTEGVRRGMYRPLGSGDVDVPPSSATCAAATTVAGTSWSRTPSSPGSPAAKARSPTSGRAPTTCVSY